MALFKYRAVNAAGDVAAGELEAANESEIVERLRHVVDQDKIVIEERSLMALARASEGSMRDGLSLLDQAVAFGGTTMLHADLEALLGAGPQELVRSCEQRNTPPWVARAHGVDEAVLDKALDLRAIAAGKRKV